MRAHRFNYRISTSKHCFICNTYTHRAFVTGLNQYIDCQHYTPNVMKYLDIIDDNGYKVVTVADYVDKLEYWVWNNGFTPLYTYLRNGFNLLSCGRGLYTVVHSGIRSLSILTPRGVYVYKIPEELSIVSLKAFAISDNELLLTSLSNLGFYLVLVHLDTMESEIKRFATQGYHYNVLSLADKLLFGWYASPYYIVFDTKSYETRTEITDTHFSVIDEFTRLGMSLNLDFVGVMPESNLIIGNGYGVHTFEYRDKLYYRFWRGRVCFVQLLTITIIL